MINAIVLMLVLGAILGLGLAFADMFLKVEVDERIEKVAGLLPGYNCGSCGFPGCSGLAEALVSGQIKSTSQCRPCKPEQRQAIVDYFKEAKGPNGEVVEVTL